MTLTRRLPLSAKVFLVWGLWLVALGLYFALLRPALLREDPRDIGSSLQTVRAAVPGLESWLAKRESGTFAVLVGIRPLFLCFA